MGRIGFTCRHDVTPRSSCKLCMAEDARMNRASTAKPARKPKLSAKERHKFLVEMNRRILSEKDN